jgi:hypothetical protein
MRQLLAMVWLASADISVKSEEAESECERKLGEVVAYYNLLQLWRVFPSF